MLVKVEGTNLYRDTETMALINRDTREKNDYIMKSRLIKNQKDQINTVKEEIEVIRGEMSEIKQLMIKLLEKGSNG
jgi:hypothetical protein